MGADVKGREICSNRKIAVPVHLRRTPSLQDEIKRMVRNELSIAAQNKGYESFEEADDFELDTDSELPYSIHEITEMQQEVPVKQFRKTKETKASVAPPTPPVPPKAGVASTGGADEVPKNEKNEVPKN